MKRPSDLILLRCIPLVLLLQLIAFAHTQQSPKPANLSSVSGVSIRGTLATGKTPLPGVAVLATNTSTGKRYATVSDIRGDWSMRIPIDGRYILSASLTGFASETQRVWLHPGVEETTLRLTLTLASRAAQKGTSDRVARFTQRRGTNAAVIGIFNALNAESATGDSALAGVALPSAAQSESASADSVAINGQTGSVDPFAGMNLSEIRDAIRDLRAQNGGPGGRGRRGFGGNFGGGGLLNFRKFRPDQPHGAVFWTGSNSTLNALPFTLNGQQENQPAYGSNRFGVTLIGEPFLPGLTHPSGKDTVFLTVSGQRSSTPYNAYGTVPTAAQRGNCSAPGSASSTPVCKLLAYYPQPNLDAGSNTQNYNYFLASTAQNNSTQLGFRYNRTLGGPSSPAGIPAPLAALLAARSSQSGGLRHSIFFNFNWSHTAADLLNLFPGLGGQQSTDQYSFTGGYSLGYHHLNNTVSFGWNRSNLQTTNFFTNRSDAASAIGILGPNNAPLNSYSLNWGVPSVIVTGFTALTEQQPALHLQQVVSLTDTLSIIRGSHNIRAGGDIRHVYLDVLGSSNATGTLYFTGLFTGDALTDLLSGEAQESSIKSVPAKSYLRQDAWDFFAQDDYRATASLTLNYGLRYEYFSPYTELHNHLAAITGNSDFSIVSPVYPGCVGSFCAGLPASLVDPFRVGVAPRVGIAQRLPHAFVLRLGYGINFANGQYASFATNLAHQPPYANVQTNEATRSAPIPLAHPFDTPASAQPANYSLDLHYHLPYVQAWNLDIQKTLPWALLLNIGYNGSKGTHLDITSAPRPTLQTNTYNLPDVLFNYEQSAAFSSFNAGTIRVRRRLEHGVSLGAYYQYSHSIDNAGSIGGSSTVVAQNWQNLLAEEGNSSFDIRHRVSGNYLFELPFGPDKYFLNSGSALSRAFEGWSISGSFIFATGTPLTPDYGSAIIDVARATAGTLRPDRVPGISITAGAGSQSRWFNPFAYIAPSGPYGNASRNSIPGPGTISNNMSLSKTAQLGDTRSLELRATASNVFNTVQFSGVDTNLISPTVGQVTSTATMRQFNFLARLRF